MNKSKIIIENTDVMGWKGALRGMRNPKNSWHLSDSNFYSQAGLIIPVIGEKDLDLCLRLIKGGPEHRKFLRMIHVQMDITAPYYFVQEMDTYNVGTTRNSCSFMHKGTAKEFDENDFAFDVTDIVQDTKMEINQVLDTLNSLRKQYLETKDMDYFRLIRQLLPAGYMVRFTWDGNYENLLNIYRQRKTHRLVEWHDFCDWIESLPYMKEFLGIAKEKEEEKTTEN